MFELTFWQAEKLQTWNRDIFIPIVAELLSWALAALKRIVGLYRRTQCASGLLWATAVKTNSPNSVSQYRLALEDSLGESAPQLRSVTHAHTHTHNWEGLLSGCWPGTRVSIRPWTSVFVAPKIVSCSCLSLVRNPISWIEGINSGSPCLCLGTGWHCVGPASMVDLSRFYPKHDWDRPLEPKSPSQG